MTTFASMSSAEVLIKVNVPDGRVHKECKLKDEVEVGDVLRSLQLFCGLSKESAKYFSLYTIENVPLRSSEFTQKIYVDQRISSWKMVHHFDHKDSIWELNYGLKYYPVNIMDDDWMGDSEKMLYFHQIHQDIEDGFISLKHYSNEDMKTLIIQFYKASGQKLGQNFVFHKNIRCKDLVTELVESGAGDHLPDLDKRQSLPEWHKRVSELPGYGAHPFIAHMLRGINRKSVLISGGYRGICIKNYHDSENQDLLIWENIYKVSYKAAKLVIKHSYPPDKDIKKSVFYTDRKVQAKNIWKSIVDQHGFFRLARHEPSSLPLSTLLDRKSNFRHFLIGTERQGKYVIGSKDECHWGVVELPLTQDVASLDYQVEIKLCYLPKGNEYYYDITEDTSRHHGLYEVEEKVHCCVEPCI